MSHLCLDSEERTVILPEHLRLPDATLGGYAVGSLLNKGSMMKINELAERRYTTKAFDPGKKILPEQMAQLKVLLRNSPSSVNSQPWHFMIAETDLAKQRLTTATEPASQYNSAKILNASHVVVFCARKDIDHAHLNRLLAQEEQDGRFPSLDAKTAQQNGRQFYTNLHKETRNDLDAWIDRQVYIALGMALLGAAAMEIDSCSIEGFDAALLDAELKLPEQGLRSVVMLALGYRSNDDFNAKLPKSRLPVSEVISVF